MLLVDLIRPGTSSSRVILLIGIGVGVALSIACAIPLLFESMPTTENKWRWDALTPQEIDVLYEKLRNTGEQTILIGCINADCADLADSFRQLFTKLKWANSPTNIPMTSSGLVGIFLDPSDEITLQLKTALESSTRLEVTLGRQRSTTQTRPPTLLIGAKPQVLSETERTQFADELEGLSAEILEFVDDRAREHRLLPLLPKIGTGIEGGNI